MRTFILATIMGSLTMTVSPLAAQDSTDRFLWLEDVTGEKPLAWVTEQNARTVGALARSDAFTTLESRLLSIYDSRDRIPFVQKIGSWYYNFWQDADHVRGIWRRTSLDEYRKPRPQWETVLDLDLLGRRGERELGLAWQHMPSARLREVHHLALARWRRRRCEARVRSRHQAFHPRLASSCRNRKGASAGSTPIPHMYPPTLAPAR